YRDAVLVFEFTGGVEEQAVLDDRAADIGAVGQRIGLLHAQVLVQQAVGGEAVLRVIDVARGRTQALGGPQNLRPSLEFVGAALGDDVHHATSGAAELGAVTAGDRLVLADAVERQRGRAQVGQRVGDGVAIDVERVLRSCRTAEGGHIAVARVSRDHAWSQQGKCVDVAADRHLGDLFGGEYRAGVGGGDVDRGHRAATHFDAVQFGSPGGAAYRAE